MARQTTKRKVETPEDALIPSAVEKEIKDRVANLSAAELIKHEIGIDALRAEIDRLNWVIRQKDLTINALQKGNEQISDELSKERNK